MKKTINAIVAVLLSVAIMLSLVGCIGSNREIEQLMSDFEGACNRLDFNAVLDCIDPNISDKLDLAAGIVGMFADMDKEEMFEKLAGFISKEDIGGADFFSSIKIDVKEIEVNEEEATVDVFLSYDFRDEVVEKEAVFSCIYYAEKWYISNFSFVK